MRMLAGLVGKARLRASAIAVTLACLIGLAVAVAAPAEASGPFLWSNHNSKAAVCGAVNCPYGPGWLVQNGTHITMVCWLDSKPWPKGNYSTPRWFGVRVPGISGVVYANASYVYNQVSVRHC